MPYEITNSLRGPSLVRAVDAGTYTITLNDLRANTTTETVSAANIRRLVWSTNGSITITRNSIPLLALHSAGEMRLDEFSHAISNSSASSIVLTITTGGSIVLELAKFATYNVAPDTGRPI